MTKVNRPYMIFSELNVGEAFTRDTEAFRKEDLKNDILFFKLSDTRAIMMDGTDVAKISYFTKDFPVFKIKKWKVTIHE